MICARHNAIATHRANGVGYCSGCFEEARAVADARYLEAKISAMRLTSADALMRRLGGK